MAVLVLAEHDNAALSPATRTTVTAASQLGAGPVAVLVAGHNAASVAAAAAGMAGGEKVLPADAPA